MFELDEFVADCQAALAEDQAPVAIKEVLARALTRPAGID